MARRPGRRPGPTETRGAILSAAREMFAEHGYDRATIRGIARRAEVDPALVHHFFGNKEQVFVAAMELPFQPADVLPELLSGPQEELPERLVRFFFSVWEDPDRRAPFIGLLRSALTASGETTMMGEFVTSALFERVAEHVGVPERDATLLMGQLVGVAMLRYVVRIEPLASAEVEDVIQGVLPAVRSYIVRSPQPEA
ncbi:MAG: TetR family transcriptional regulator [Streptosporangiales bacterium]|nr:TetR family transcriptional regulator [Streptosporangiales bacterium]